MKAAAGLQVQGACPPVISLNSLERDHPKARETSEGCNFDLHQLYHDVIDHLGQ